MKVVVCKNCGANFQIDDNEDINTYECSVCAGDLMYDENYENIPSQSRTQRFNTDFLEKTYYMVQCEDCGLKYRLDKTDNINDYMCTSCGGRLQYIDKDLNQNIKTQNIQNNQFETDVIQPETYDDGYIYVDHSNDETYDNEDDEFYNSFKEDTYFSEEYNSSVEIDNNSNKDNISNINNEDNLTNYSDDIIYVDHGETDETIDLNNYVSYEDNIQHNKPASLYPKKEEAALNNEKLIVPDSLDYNELRTYLIESFSENMEKRYKIYNVMKDKKSDAYNSKNNLNTTKNNYYNDNVSTSINSSKNTDFENSSKLLNRFKSETDEKNDYNVSKTVSDEFKPPKKEKGRFGFLNWGNSKFKDIRDLNYNEEDNNFKPQIDQHQFPIDNSNYTNYQNVDDSLFYESEILNPETTLEDLDNIKKQNLVPDPNETSEPYSYIYIGVGALIMILGFFDTIRSNRTYSLIYVFIGMAIFAVGLLKNREFGEREKRGRIIRSKLLTLPENFYVLYYVKVPESNDGINHVVIGPTGIYTIVSQKFDAKEDKDRIKQENETKQLISLLGEDSDQRLIPDENPITAKFIKPEQKIRFEHNNRIKQKVLRLSYELEDFLKENDLECPIEPYVGFVNQDVAVLNSPLKDEDYFIDELLNKIVNSPVKINLNTVHKCAILLTQYSTKCSN